MEGSLVAYKVFTNGSTLQASEINDNLMRQSVMVFSNAAARTAAITVPLEGMLTWLEDVNQYQFYNGTDWQNNTPGLVHINTQTFTGATSFSFPNNSFTSAFDSYQIIFVHEAGSATQNVSFRLRTAGTDNSTSQYVNMIFQSFPGGTDSSGAVQTSMSLYPGGRMSGLSKMILSNPAKALKTGVQSDTAAFFHGPGVTTNINLNYSHFDALTVFDSCSFIASTGNFTGYAQLYGLRK
jgi:hypothetical protein